MRTLLAGLLLVAPAAHAQEPPAPLTAGVFNIPPFAAPGLAREETGEETGRDPGPEYEPTGFMVDLAKELAGELGTDLRFVDYPITREFIAAQRSGATQIIAGIARLPVLEDSSVFSQPVATETLRLTALTSMQAALSRGPVTGKRIGIVPPAVGSDVEEVLARNTVVEFVSPEAAMMNMVMGKVDAILIPEPVAFYIARRAGLDARIGFVEPPVRQFDRHVALHTSRADLMPQVNAALDRMEQDGRLTALRQRYFVDTPAPVPDVLSVGVTHFPPFHTVEDGAFSGFFVDVLRDLAALSGIELDFQETDRETALRGPRSDSVDVLPQLAISPEREARMDFTLPLEETRFSLFMRAGQDEAVSGLSDLGARTLGLIANTQSARIAQRQGVANLQSFSDPADMLDALLEGRIDVVMYPSESFWTAMRARGTAEEVVEIAPPVAVLQRAIALRPGLGPVRERLNAVIPGYLVSETYKARVETWFGDPGTWTRAELRNLALLALAALVALGGGVLLVRRRQAQIALRTQYDLLRSVARNLTSEILLVDAGNRIVYANEHAAQSVPDPSLGPIEGRQHGVYVSELVDRGMLRIDGRNPEEVKTALDIRGKDAGQTIVYQAGDRIMRRSSRLLEAGMTLLVREDITVDRQQLADISNLNTQLTHLVGESDAANKELKAFAYATSHDLKAPTNTMHMLVDALREDSKGGLDAAGMGYLDAMKQTMQRMSDLIDNVLDYTQTISDKGAWERVDLGEMVKEIQADLASDIKDSDARFDIGPLPVLEASRFQMRLLFQNLLQNAIKYRDPDKSLCIRLRSEQAPDGFWAIAVEDNGLGIDPAYHDKVFDLFFQVRNASQPAGAGLGLSICQRVVKTHRGRIEMTSQPGSGTTFTLFLRGGPP